MRRANRPAKIDNPHAVTHTRRMISRSGLVTIAMSACLLTPSAHADVAIGASGVLALGTGALDLGCTDITIASAGILTLNGGVITGARNVTIQSGGLLDFGTGSITFAGAFVN